MVTTMFRWKRVNMSCLNKLAEFLIYAMIVDFSLELLDFIQRLYESEESITILSQMISSRLFISLIVSQIIIGGVIPLVSLIWARFGQVPDEMRRITYFIAALLVQVGIFSTRWNVVIGGQLFSKSLRGLTVYKIELFGFEGLLMAIFLLILPFILLYIMTKVLPPWSAEPESSPAK
jgi:predicted membrane protein